MKKHDNNKKALDFYKVLSHKLSDKILPLLSKKELPVTEIYNTLKLEQSQCSVHLSRLREKGLVIGRKDGKKVFYSVVPEMLEKADQAARLITG